MAILTEENPPAGIRAKETDSESSNSIKDPDQAYSFLQNLHVSDVEVGQINLKALRRKVDWRIVPVMFLCYTMQFIDKVSLNYAAVMGIRTELNLTGNQFSNAASAFFIAFLIAEIPNGYILNKVPAGRWLGLNVVLWGIATSCTAAAHDYRTLLAARIFLGIFEAAIAPCLILISSQWYTKSEQAPRFSFWYCGLGVGQIIGGLVSFGFQYVENPSISSWRVMFVVLGVITVLIGMATAFVLPDNPMKAGFLSDVEKAAILRHTASNQTGVQNRHFKASHLFEIIFDVQIWLLMLITILATISSGIVTTYSATLIRGFGYDPKVSALLNMPSGIISILSVLGTGFGVRYFSQRWAFFAACCIPGVLGGALMSFLPSSNQAGLLTGIYLVNSIVATLSITYLWTASNVAGHTKRVVSMALITGSFSVGSIIGPQTFQDKDAPQYIPAKITVLATQAAAALLACLLFLYYLWTNKKRDAMRGTSDENEELGQWDNLTDRENSRFRYVY